jgi:hypothetical protein
VCEKTGLSKHAAECGEVTSGAANAGYLTQTIFTEGAPEIPSTRAK